MVYDIVTTYTTYVVHYLSPINLPVVGFDSKYCTSLQGLGYTGYDPVDQ